MSTGEITAHYNEVCGEIRLYGNGATYQNRSQYCTIVNVLWISQRFVQLQGAKGKISRPIIIKLGSVLYKKGVRLIHIRRTKGHTAPFSDFLFTDENEDVFEVDLRKYQHLISQ